MKSKRLLLKHGESENTHFLSSKKEFSYTQLREANSFDVVLASDGLINHEEHGDIIVPEDNKTKTIICSQSEYDPFANNYRQVFD